MHRLLLLLLCLAHVLVSALPRPEHPRLRKRATSLGTLEGFPGKDQTFDYVIIGGGTAGLVMAARLSEDATKNVAVIEAGTFYEHLVSPIIISAPAGDGIGVGSGLLDTELTVDWGFFTTPQAGAAYRTLHYDRGKCLGGSSAKNFMLYQRGTIGSYQKWADQVGDQSYTFDNLLPYFKKSVTFTPPNLTKRAANATALYDASAFDPAGGPLHVSYPNYAQPSSSYMQGGLNEIGISSRVDFNSGNLFGAQYASSTIDPNGEIRASSEEAFLTSAMGRSNLKVFQLSMAKKILFDANKRATGVIVQTAGITYVLSASREVILSAGAFHSPQMLMVSGIGPAATLRALGIPVIVDNPNVGQNMQDHVFSGPTYRINVETITKIANDALYFLEQLLGPYLLAQEGPITSPSCDFLGWEKVPDNLRANFTPAALADLASFPADWPELEYISGAGFIGDFGDLLLTQPKDGYQYFTILSTIVAPQSRGTVTIISPDTDVLPVINPNWLTSPTDQQVAVAGFKRARAAFATEFMQRAIIGDEYFPGPLVQSDAQILQHYRQTLMTVWHASCTCAMGTVIDTHARVLGVKGLRVVDVSSFPLLPPGHPQSTIYALAEKIADMMKNGQ